MQAIKNLFKRILERDVIDPHQIANGYYNEPAGAIKMIQMEPVIKAPVGANDQIPFGSYVRVTGTSYQLRLLGKDFSTTKTYRQYDIVAQDGFVWTANEHLNAGAWDATKWTRLAPATVGPITVAAGSVVSCGRYHNNVNAAGFLIDDDSTFKKRA